MNTTLTANVDDIAKILAKGIASDLVPLIEAELHAHVDPIVSNFARKLAAETVVKMQAYQGFDPRDGFPPSVKMQLVFNNELVDYKA